MTGTYTTTESFTLTHAKYLASKVAADLYQMQIFYGVPSMDYINKYIEEIIVLLLYGYFDSADYGFKKNNEWVMVVHYEAKYGILNSTDDRSGGVYSGADTSGTYWSSYLKKNSKFWNLAPAEQSRIEGLLPIKRTTGDESGYQAGVWTTDKSYYSNGTGLDRKFFRPL